MDNILCIDLKSFFASVEAVERGLDPFKTNLVVADPSRGNGAICLAITPAMKKLGIKNRCRIFEIPKNIGLNNIVDEDSVGFQLDLFSDVEQSAKERKVQEAVLNIKNKFGKNAVLRGISLEKKATAKIRNKLVGGHNGE